MKSIRSCQTPNKNADCDDVMTIHRNRAEVPKLFTMKDRKTNWIEGHYIQLDYIKFTFLKMYILYNSMQNYKK